MYNKIHQELTYSDNGFLGLQISFDPTFEIYIFARNQKESLEAQAR